MSLLFAKKCSEINKKLYSLIMRKFSRYCFHVQMNRLTNLHNYSLYRNRKKEGPLIRDPVLIRGNMVTLKNVVCHV